MPHHQIRIQCLQHELRQSTFPEFLQAQELPSVSRNFGSTARNYVQYLQHLLGRASRSRAQHRCEMLQASHSVHPLFVEDGETFPSRTQDDLALLTLRHLLETNERPEESPTDQRTSRCELPPGYVAIHVPNAHVTRPSQPKIQKCPRQPKLPSPRTGRDDHQDESFPP